MEDQKTFQREYIDSDDYEERNPDWHTEHSWWKASHVLKMIRRNKLTPKTICDVGCGAGEVLRQLQLQMEDDCVFTGYDVSPRAIELCQSRANERLHFKLDDITQERDTLFDLLLVMDVIEHLEDYYSFLRGIRERGIYKMFHIPLEVSAQSALRKNSFLFTRKQFFHIHHFNKEVALKILEDTGYEVIDYSYTAWSLEIPNRGLRARLLGIPRRLFYAIDSDFAVRLLGGYSLMVLTK